MFFMNICNICNNSLCVPKNDDSGEVSVFGCGHSYHQNCVVRSESTELTCPLCKTKFRLLPRHESKKRLTTDINTRVRPDLEGHF